ncbi:MAG: hypothetical protein ACHBN1_04075 [Heteroscytonema crispum UTEX LB 1556]
MGDKPDRCGCGRQGEIIEQDSYLSPHLPPTPQVRGPVAPHFPPTPTPVRPSRGR